MRLKALGKAPITRRAMREALPLSAPMSITLRHTWASATRAPSAGSVPSSSALAQPCASATALTAPALVPLMASKCRRPSASSVSSTPQVKAPWAPPPCRAR